MTPQQLNTLLGVDLVVASQKDGLVVDVLNRLTEFLDSHVHKVSEAPRLASMKCYLKQNWKGVESKDEKAARSSMTGLHTCISRFSDKPSSGSNGFFDIEPNDEVDNLLGKLKAQNYEGVIALLEEMQAKEQIQPE